MTEDNPTAPSAEAVMSGDLSIREPPLILVPLEVLEGETVSDSLIDFLAPSEVVILGYHVLPEQTPTEQASMQFEDRAQQAVEDIATTFRKAGRDVETRVAFTHDRDQTIKRVTEDVGATATLLPNPVGEVTDLVVPIRDAIDHDRLADLVATLIGGRAGTVTLWGLTPDDGAFDAERAVANARDSLRDRGLPPEQIITETSSSNAPIQDIVTRSSEFDVIVMGEGGLSMLRSLFGEASERVAEGAVSPVLVVRDRKP